MNAICIALLDPTRKLTLGDRPSSFPLGLSILDQLIKHAPWGIRQEPLYPPLALLLQEPDRPCQSPSRPRRTGERVNLPSRLSPNLRSGRLDVRLSIGDIIKLVRPHRIIQAIRVSFGLMVIVLRVIERYRGDRPHVRSQHPQEVDLLLTLRIRHVDDAFIPFTPTDVCEADPRVPRGALDDGATRLKQPLGFSVLYQPEGGTVFDGPSWGHEFGFGEDVTASLFGETVEPDLWRGC